MAISNVQRAVGNSTAAEASRSVWFDADTGSGSDRYAIACVAWYVNGDPTSRQLTITNAGPSLTWVEVQNPASVASETVAYCAMFYAQLTSAIASTNAITIGYTGTQNWDHWYTVAILEVSGLATSNVVDRNDIRTTTSSSWSTPASGAGTTAQADELLVGCVTHDGYATTPDTYLNFTLTTPWTNDTDDVTPKGWSMENTSYQNLNVHSRVVSSTGQYYSVGDLEQASAGSNPYRWHGVFATFKGGTAQQPTNVAMVRGRMRW